MYRRANALPYACVLAFVLLAGIGVSADARFVLAPPLVVVAFEASVEPACPWRRRPFATLLACCGAGAIGNALRLGLGANPLAVALAVGGGLAVLAVLRLHIPPALAIGVLPFVMPHPTALYPLSVALGATLAALSYSGCRVAQRWLTSQPAAVERARQPLAAKAK